MSELDAKMQAAYAKRVKGLYEVLINRISQISMYVRMDKEYGYPLTEYSINNFLFNLMDREDQLEKRVKNFTGKYEPQFLSELANPNITKISELEELERKLLSTLSAIEANISGVSLVTEEVIKSKKKDEEIGSGDADAVLDLFKKRLREEAFIRLEQNRKELDTMEIQYREGLGSEVTSKEPKALWERLEVLIEKDKQLYKSQKYYENKAALLRGEIFPLLSNFGIAWFNENDGSYRILYNDKPLPKEDRIKVMGKEFTEKFNLIETCNKQALEIIAARNGLRIEYPALGVFKPEDIKDKTDHNKIFKLMSKGFAKAREAQNQVKEMVFNDKLPLNKITPIVETVLEEFEQKGYFKNKLVKDKIEGWINQSKMIDMAINIIGTSVTIIFTAVAFFTTGGAALVFGLAASVIGLGMSVYDFTIAFQVNAMAEAQKGGRHLFINEKDAESARFNYTMAWVNLFLSALDVAMSVKALTKVVKAEEAISEVNKLKKLDNVEQLSKDSKLIDKLDEVEEVEKIKIKEKKVNKPTKTDEETLLKVSRRKRAGVKYSTLNDSGHSVRIQNSVVDSLEDGQIIAFTKRSPKANALDYKYKSKPDATKYLTETKVYSKNGTDTGKRIITYIDEKTGEVVSETVVSDMDVAFMVDKDKKLISEDYIENVFGKKMNKYYDKDVVMHGDTVTGITKKGISGKKAKDVIKRNEIIYIYGKNINGETGIIDFGPFKEMLKKYGNLNLDYLE